MKTVQVLYFAALAETLGVDAEALSVPAHIDSVAALRGWIADRGQPWEAIASMARIGAARNQRMVTDMAEQFADGDEIAFFPPVTGG